MEDVSLPEGWKWATLQDLGPIISGGTPKTSDPTNFDGDIPWITPADLTGYTQKTISGGRRNITKRGLKTSSARIIPKRSVVFSSRAPIGYVAIAASELTTNQGFKSVAVNDQIDETFVYFYLKSAKHLAEENSSGTTFKEISGSRFAQLPIPVAPLNEQRRIVEKIETLFTRIDKGEEALRQVQKLLSRYRQSVLKAAVTGQLTADWRAENAHRLEHGRDLLARILQTRRETWRGRGKYKEPNAPDTSGLPELPEGWVWASVDQVVGMFRNGLSRKPFLERNDFPILRISATRAMDVSIDDLRYYRPTQGEDVSPYWVERGDLLFTRYNGSAHLVGVCGQMRESDPVLHPDKLIKARPVAVDGLSTDYLEAAWNTGTTRRHIAANIKTTSGQQGISGADIKGAAFPLPPAEEQAQIAQLIWDAFDRIGAMEKHCETELARSAALRQSILKDAFAGRLVPQDPADEPAAELLARIKETRIAAPRKSQRKATA
ncbi:MAG: restriction endonuclease subunit S [Nitrococcus mobilis]|nr:restriction endonuclease subunit S [Nitrococcus mobilis]